MKIIYYTVHNQDDIPLAAYNETEYTNARAHAQVIEGMVIQYTYTFEDTNMIHDFRTIHHTTSPGADDNAVG